MFPKWYRFISGFPIKPFIIVKIDLFSIDHFKIKLNSFFPLIHRTLVQQMSFGITFFNFNIAQGTSIVSNFLAITMTIGNNLFTLPAKAHVSSFTTLINEMVFELLNFNDVPAHFTLNQ